MKKVSIHQPAYIPWLGYFYKIASADVFVFLDDVQYCNDTFQNYNEIKTPNGKFRLRCPIVHHFGDMLNNIRTRDELKWKDKHLKTIQANYARSKNFHVFYPKLMEVLLRQYESLSEMNIDIVKLIAKELGIDTPMIKSSELNVNTFKQERIIDIVTSLGGDVYMSGNGARGYQQEENFTQKGISLKYLQYKPVVYNQLFGDFIPNLSAIDYIFNVGKPIKFNYEI